MMADRTLQQDHLALAERHVAEGENTVAHQQRIVAELERDGHTAAAEKARELLAKFEEALALHVAHRERLLNELRRGGGRVEERGNDNQGTPGHLRPGAVPWCVSLTRKIRQRGGATGVAAVAF